MVMEFLGPSLKDLFEMCNQKFSLQTVCMIAIQCINIIENLHNNGIVHQDIKPENFLMGMGQKSHLIHLIDYGLSKKYLDKKT